jgi:hypothetical protein
MSIVCGKFIKFLSVLYFAPSKENKKTRLKGLFTCMKHEFCVVRHKIWVVRHELWVVRHELWLCDATQIQWRDTEVGCTTQNSAVWQQIRLYDTKLGHTTTNLVVRHKIRDSCKYPLNDFITNLWDANPTRTFSDLAYVLLFVDPVNIIFIPQLFFGYYKIKIWSRDAFQLISKIFDQILWNEIWIGIFWNLRHYFDIFSPIRGSAQP